MSLSLAARRLVVKIGSALVVDRDAGRAPRPTGWRRVAADIAALRGARDRGDRRLLRRHRAGAAHASA